MKIDTPNPRTILFGTSAIDLSAVEQLVDGAQTLAVGWAVHALSSRHFRGGVTLEEALGGLEEELDREGLDLLLPWRTGRLARARTFEIAAAINRLRGVRVKCS